MGNVLGLARRARLQPILMKRHQPQIAADAAEAVDVSVADLPPVVELDAELEGTLGLTNELRFVDFEQAVELRKRRNRRLAHPDGPNFFGLNERDFDSAAKGLRDCRGAHPTGRAAADNDD